jgi:hypothetical protein
MPAQFLLSNDTEPSTFTSQQWTIDGTPYPNQSSVTFTPIQPGVFDIALEASTAIGCTYDTLLTEYLQAFPQPQANYTTDPLLLEADNTDVTLIDLSEGDIATWEWTISLPAQEVTSMDQSPEFSLPLGVGGSYPVQLAVTSSNGCSDFINGVITVNELFNLFVPSAFTPNGDGINDVFPGLVNVSTLAMAPPPADGTAQITNILSLSCATGNTVPTEPGRFTVDCPETTMQGLVVTSDATFGTDVTVTGAVSAASATVTGAVSAASATVADQLVVGANGSGTGEIILNGETGDITLYGESLAEKFTARQSHTFSGESFLTVDQPDCPTGFDPDIAVMPVTFKTTEDLRAVETEVTTSGSAWKVKLLVKSEQNGGGNATQTQTNPTGSKVVVLTGCSP